MTWVSLSSRVWLTILISKNIRPIFHLYYSARNNAMTICIVVEWCFNFLSMLRFLTSNIHTCVYFFQSSSQNTATELLWPIMLTRLLQKLLMTFPFSKSVLFWKKCFCHLCAFFMANCCYFLEIFSYRFHDYALLS